MSRISSCPVVVDGDRDVHAVLVVAVDPLDRRHAPGPHAVLGRGRSRGAAPPSLAVDDAVDAGVGQPGRRLGRGGRLGIAQRHPAVEAGELTGRDRRRPLDHLPHRRVGSGDLLPLAVAQHLDMQQQRLLDLGRVEQPTLALGRDLRMVGQHNRGADHRVVVVVASTGKMFPRSTHGLPGGRRTGATGEAKRCPGVRDEVRGEQRGPQRGGAVEPLRHRWCCGRTSGSAPAVVERRRRQPCAALHGVERTRPSPHSSSTRRSPLGSGRHRPGPASRRAPARPASARSNVCGPRPRRPAGNDAERRRRRVLGRPGVYG